jgi:hypothetical protein
MVMDERFSGTDVCMWLIVWAEGCPRSANRSTWGLVSLKFPFSPLAIGLVSASTEQVNAMQREEDKTHLGRASSAIIIHRLALTSSQRVCRILNNPKKARIPNVNVGNPVSNSRGGWFLSALTILMG